jgi:hypothetical protein
VLSIVPLDMCSICGSAGWACLLRFAAVLQVYWLVLAHTQDHPDDKYATEFRDACERAAVEGYWVSTVLQVPHTAGNGERHGGALPCCSTSTVLAVLHAGAAVQGRQAAAAEPNPQSNVQPAAQPHGLGIWRLQPATSVSMLLQRVTGGAMFMGSEPSSHAQYDTPVGPTWNVARGAVLLAGGDTLLPCAGGGATARTATWRRRRAGA